MKMKKIHFTTSRGVGFVEIPDDTKSIKLPKGLCHNCNEEPLLPPDVEANETTEEDDNKLLPNQ
jgi:hypothetical protein